LFRVISASVDGNPSPVDDVGWVLRLQAFPFGAPALDSQPGIRRHGDQFVARQVVDVVDGADQVRRDPPRPQFTQCHSKLVGEPEGGVEGQLP